MGKTAKGPEDPGPLRPEAILDKGNTAVGFNQGWDRWGWMGFMNLEFTHLKTTCRFNNYVTAEEVNKKKTLESLDWIYFKFWVQSLFFF